MEVTIRTRQGTGLCLITTILQGLCPINPAGGQNPRTPNWDKTLGDSDSPGKMGAVKWVQGASLPARGEMRDSQHFGGEAPTK